jgi:hypothetical protein
MSKKKKTVEDVVEDIQNHVKAVKTILPHEIFDAFEQHLVTAYEEARGEERRISYICSGCNGIIKTILKGGSDYELACQFRALCLVRTKNEHIKKILNGEHDGSQVTNTSRLQLEV